MSAPTDVIKQLNSAREICLKEPTTYSQVVPGVLPVIGPSAHLELRRWGSDFLAETFASPVVNGDEKQKLSLLILDTLKGYLSRKEVQGEEEDRSVTKSAVQCAASIYPLVFRHTVSNASDSERWNKMAGIKSSILRRLDTASGGVRICCIKFVARVVQVQTPGLIADPRRPEQNEISLALVPREHAIIPPSNLEAEASGLLDRLLGVLQENPNDALIVTATLNSLSTLVQRRASISTKILTTIVSFNPLMMAHPKMGDKDVIAVKSMTRTTMSFLLNVLKRNPNHPLAGRIQHQVETLRLRLSEMFTPIIDRKRSADDEPVDGLDDVKRRRIDEETVAGTTSQQSTLPTYPPLPPGPVTYAQLFTLGSDSNAAGFHVEAIPLHFVTQLIPPLLHSIDQSRLTHAINTVRSRYLNLGQRPATSATNAAKAVLGEEEDDDYDPSMGFGGSSQEQVLNRLDQLPLDGTGIDVAIGPFHLPPPPPLSDEERDEYSKTAMTRVFSTLEDHDRQARVKGGKKQESEKGFNRLAASSQDREGWITVLARLATRASFGLDVENGKVKREDEDHTLAKKGSRFDLANGIRETLKNYFLADWRRRIDVAITWLNEEWYADRLLQKAHGTDSLPHYERFSLSVLDSMTPYLDDAKDGRLLIRFLAEIPQISRQMLERVKKVADDPERITIATNALLYLIMFKPPVRGEAIQATVDLWTSNDDAKGACVKILSKWRPEVLQEETKGTLKAEA